MFAKRDKHYRSRSGQTSEATAVTNFTKPVTLINFWPSTLEVELNGNSTLGLDGILLENVEPAVCRMFW